MKLPFPGMDPFLEAPRLWPDVHHRLISAFCDQLQQQLDPNYVAVITPYVAFESLQIGPTRMAFAPDVGVVEPEPQVAAGAAPTTAVAIAPAPVTLPADMTIPTRYARLEIRTVDDETLITAVELLSPANKRAGSNKTSGAGAYDDKRQEIFQTGAHLLEIDLLRNGTRPSVSGALPHASYFIFLSRAERRPNIDIWPVALPEPLPVVPVPLRRPDPDVTLDIGVSLRQIYASAHYERRIDYCADPPPPGLSDEDAAWLNAHLREQKLRP